MKEYSIKMLNGNIPVVYEEFKEDLTDAEGVNVINNDLLVINPRDFNKLKCVTYCYTLLPYRNDMVCTRAQLTKAVGLNLNSKGQGAQFFECDSINDVLEFFKLSGGRVNPMIQDWVLSKNGISAWKQFHESEDITDLNSAGDHGLVMVLKKLGAVKSS